MLPEVIIHASIGLDGAYTGFDVDMEAHYRAAGSFGADMHLIGSNTIKKGIELFGTPQTEEATDYIRPVRDEGLPRWAVIDTRGSLLGLLHHIRRFELCHDVIIIIAESTPEEYIRYLWERDYTYHVTGKTRADLRATLALLQKTYNANTIITDTGKILSNLLLDQGLASKLSLLVHPVIIGHQADNLFSNLTKGQTLSLEKSEPVGSGCLWLVYRVAA